MPVVNPGGPAPLPPTGSTAPCAWTVDTGCCSDWDTFTPQVQARATSWATGILWALTGRRFGVCDIVVRPCGSTCNYYGGYMSYPVITDGIGTVFAPFVRDGTWFNCACSGACSCEARCAVWLPGPVAVINEVVVDGIVIPDTSYRVDNREWLIRTDGECWPECQNLDLNSPAVGTFEVSYGRGNLLPATGQIAAGLLACEFAKACNGQACALPGNLSTLARQGVQVTMIDPTDALDAGLTGLPEVDLWIRSVNPDRKTHRPRVYSPDLHFPSMRTS